MHRLPRSKPGILCATCPTISVSWSKVCGWRDCPKGRAQASSKGLRISPSCGGLILSAFARAVFLRRKDVRQARLALATLLAAWQRQSGAGASRPFRDLQPALYGWSRQATLQPGRYVLQGIEVHEVARAVEPDQIAHPAERGDVGDRVFVAHDPLPDCEAGVEDTEQALGFVTVALQRPLVWILPTREFVEEADLAEHRPDECHLEEQPLDGLVSARRMGRHELASLVREIEQDRAGLEEAERRPAGPVRIDDCRDLAVRVER